MIFGRFTFCNFGPGEQFCVTRKDTDVWWGGSTEIDGVHLFYDKKTGRVGSVTIDNPDDPKSVRLAAKALRVPYWWMRRKVDRLAG